VPGERGEYRPIFTRLLNGPEFKALTADARSCFYPIKLRLPAAGIGVIPGLLSTLEEDTGLSRKRIKSAVAELESKNWVRTEGGVVWLVRGLEFEPTLNLQNERHRVHIQAHVNALPTLEIVAAYRAHYAAWLQVGLSDASTKGIKGVSDGSRSTTPTPTPIPTPSPTPPGAARRLREALPEQYRTDLDTLLTRVTNPSAWAGELTMAVEGGTAGPGVTYEHLGLAIHDFCLNGKAEAPEIELFRHYVKRAASGRRPAGPAGPGRNGKAPTTPHNVTLIRSVV
jgi:hypothetical protein